MAAIGLRNRRLRALQCTASDSKRRAPVAYVAPWPRPSGVKASIDILWPMPKFRGPGLYCNVPAYRALPGPGPVLITAFFR